MPNKKDLGYLFLPSQNTPKPPTKTLEQLLPIEQLSWENFERLCYKLARSQNENIDACALYGKKGDKQEGIDIFSIEAGEEKYTVYQCKRENKFGPQKIKDAIEEFKQGLWKNRSKKFILCTKESLNTKQRQEKIITLRKELADLNISFTIWDLDELSNQLKSNPNLVYDFFGLEWVEVFLGKEQANNFRDKFKTDLPELIKKVREAALKLTTTQLLKSSTEGKLLSLSVVKIHATETKSQSSLQIHDIKALLKEKNRIILEAPAGRGKTTTLLQLANEYNKSACIAFFIELADWLISEKSIFEYLSQKPEFSSRGLDQSVLSKVYKTEQFSFLLNGWNEIPKNYSEKAIIRLQALESEYHKALILIATRTHYFPPPFCNPLHTTILPLSRQQRREYIQNSLSSEGSRLITQLENDIILNKLTRTPLFLSKVVQIFKAQLLIPTTKIGILQTIIDLPKHNSYLKQEPIQGHADYYLTELAVQMTQENKTKISEQEARKIISLINNDLKSNGQITNTPEPGDILSVLCSHHVLERSNDPDPKFHFQHPQFQEFFAARFLKTELQKITSSKDKAALDEFLKKYINEPVWGEALKIFAEDIASLSTEHPDEEVWVQLGKQLIEMSLRVDRVFTAELARLCGPLVWKEVRTTLGDSLRSWYRNSDKNYHQLALAGMIVSGSEDFKDVILPLLNNEDQQARLNTYRLINEFHYSTLGPDWSKHVQEWTEDARIDFVRELIQQRWLSEIIEVFALDPSTKVRATLIESLGWIGAEEEARRLLEAMDEEFLEKTIQEIYPEMLSTLASPRILAVYQKLYSQSSDSVSRLIFLLNIAKLGQLDVSGQLQTELDNFDRNKLKDNGEFIIKPSLKIIQKVHPEWVSNWVIEQILNGSLWYNHWNEFITTVPEDRKSQLLQRIITEDLQHQKSSDIISILAINANSKLVEKVFSSLCTIRKNTTTIPQEKKEQIIRQLEDLFRAFSPDPAIIGLSNFFKYFDELEFTTLLKILSTVGRSEYDLRNELDNDLRQNLRTYLKSGLNFVLSQADLSGELKADFASSLARIGESEDMTILHQLVQADIERIRKKLRQNQGGFMSCTYWHLRALVQLDPIAAEQVLLSLLQESEYELESAKALINLTTQEKCKQLFSDNIEYHTIWQARDKDPYYKLDETDRKRHANAITEIVINLLKEYQISEKKVLYSSRLKPLVEVLAELAPKNSVDLILQVISLPEETESHWKQIKVLEKLLMGGANLPTEIIFNLLNKVLESAQSYSFHSGSEQRKVLNKLLCILPFVDNPSKGLKKLDEVISKFELPFYELKEVLKAIGYSKCDDALSLLLKLAGPNGEHLENLEKEWIDAIANLNIPNSKKLLLSFVDSKIKEFSIKVNFSQNNNLSSRIAEIAEQDTKVEQRLLELCEKPLTPEKRNLLSSTIARLHSAESMLAGLNLINDNISPRIPPSIHKRIINSFVLRQSDNQSQTTFTIAPRSSNDIRMKLFKMAAQDENRKQAALILLGEIEVLRLNYGRPPNEPRHLCLETQEAKPNKDFS